MIPHLCLQLWSPPWTSSDWQIWISNSSPPIYLIDCSHSHNKKSLIFPPSLSSPSSNLFTCSSSKPRNYPWLLSFLHSTPTSSLRNQMSNLLPEHNSKFIHFSPSPRTICLVQASIYSLKTTAASLFFLLPFLSPYILLTTTVRVIFSRANQILSPLITLTIKSLVHTVAYGALYSFNMIF